MSARRAGRFLMAAVLVLGVWLRVTGAVVNRDANDDHLSVIRVIAHEGRFPEPDELWESFQPPLYHGVVAGILRATGPLPHEHEVVVAQLVSCAAGLVTLGLLGLILTSFPLSSLARGLALAVAALSPALVSTSIQATNDAFVILWGTMALAAGCVFLRRASVPSALVLGAALVLAGVTKGNALVTITAVFAVTTLAAWTSSPDRQRLLAGLVAMVVAVVAVVPVAGGYFSRRASMGSAFATNMPVSPAPALFRETVDKRPGILSVASGFLAFPFADMLADPLIERRDDSGYPTHRTSFWSLMYGTTHSVHYAYYPAGWRIGRAQAEQVVRVGLVAALLPTVLVAAGLMVMCRRALGEWRLGPGAPREWAPWCLLVLTAGGHVLFAAIYGYRYRDFSTMKGIFLAPAAGAGVVALAVAVDVLRRRKAAWSVAVAATVLLCLSYVADVGALIRQLSLR